MKLHKITVLLMTLLLAAGAVFAPACADKAQAPAATVAARIIKDINAREAFTLIQENAGNPGFTIVDVRTPGEFAGGHIENAVNVDFQSAMFRNDIDSLDKDKEYLIYCRSGARSRGALGVMTGLGFREVYHLTVGITGWMDEGLPVVK